MKIEKDIIGFFGGEDSLFGGKLIIQVLSSDENLECASGASIHQLGAFACRDSLTGNVTFSEMAFSYS